MISTSTSNGSTSSGTSITELGWAAISANARDYRVSLRGSGSDTMTSLTTEVMKRKRNTHWNPQKWNPPNSFDKFILKRTRSRIMPAALVCGLARFAFGYKLVLVALALALALFAAGAIQPIDHSETISGCSRVRQTKAASPYRCDR
jgi:hypothetical protein